MVMVTFTVTVPVPLTRMTPTDVTALEPGPVRRRIAGPPASGLGPRARRAATELRLANSHSESGCPTRPGQTSLARADHNVRVG